MLRDLWIEGYAIINWYLTTSKTLIAHTHLRNIDTDNSKPLHSKFIQLYSDLIQLNSIS